MLYNYYIYGGQPHRVGLVNLFKVFFMLCQIIVFNYF